LSQTKNTRLCLLGIIESDHCFCFCF
jgi:hypothetical protein